MQIWKQCSKNRQMNATIFMYLYIILERERKRESYETLSMASKPETDRFTQLTTIEKLTTGAISPATRFHEHDVKTCAR